MSHPPAKRGPGRPPAAKAAETRERIVCAAREVFSELGYDAATFQAIAVRADLTRPAINHYFASKRALYREVMAQTNAMVLEAGRQRAQGQHTFLGRLAAFLATAMQADSVDRSAAGFLVTSILESQRHPELAGGENDALRASRAFVSWVISDAVERGELSTDSDRSALVEMLVAMLWGMGFYAGYIGSHEDLEAVVDRFERLLSNTLWRVHEYRDQQ